MSRHNYNPSNDLSSTPSSRLRCYTNGNPPPQASGKACPSDFRDRLAVCALALILVAGFGLAGCGGSPSSSAGKDSGPTITSFIADPTNVNSGTSSTLSWAAAG